MEEKERSISIVNEDSSYLAGMASITALQVPIKKLHPDAIIPTYAHPTDAGLDLTAVSKTWDYDKECWIYGTGLAIAIPNGYVGLIFPRSSVRNTPLIMANCVGVVDSGYRGEVSTSFKSTNEYKKVYQIGDRIAQLIIIPYPKVGLIEVDKLPSSDRGANGHGSTGR